MSEDVTQKPPTAQFVVASIDARPLRMNRSPPSAPPAPMPTIRESRAQPVWYHDGRPSLLNWSNLNASHHLGSAGFPPAELNVPPGSVLTGSLGLPKASHILPACVCGKSCFGRLLGRSPCCGDSSLGVLCACLVSSAIIPM